MFQIFASHAELNDKYQNTKAISLINCALAKYWRTETTEIEHIVYSSYAHNRKESNHN